MGRKRCLEEERWWVGGWVGGWLFKLLPRACKQDLEGGRWVGGGKESRTETL